MSSNAEQLCSSSSSLQNNQPTFFVPHDKPQDQVIYPLLSSGYPYHYPYPTTYHYPQPHPYYYR